MAISFLFYFFGKKSIHNASSGWEHCSLWSSKPLSRFQGLSERLRLQWRRPHIDHRELQRNKDNLRCRLGLEHCHLWKSKSQCKWQWGPDLGGLRRVGLCAACRGPPCPKEGWSLLTLVVVSSCIVGGAGRVPDGRRGPVARVAGIHFYFALAFVLWLAKDWVPDIISLENCQAMLWINMKHNPVWPPWPQLSTKVPCEGLGSLL